METGTVHSGEMTMDYFTFGKGSRTLVILPGLGTRSVLFSAMMVSSAYSRFNTEFTTYVFERRSDLPSVYTVREMAHDTALAMRELGIQSADIFGASLGGMIAQFIAIDNPGLVHTLMLGSTASRVNPHLRDMSEQWAAAAERGDLDGLTRSFLRNLYSEETVARYGEILGRMNDGLTRQELERFVIQARAITGFDAYSELDRIQCPVLVLGVEGDKVVTGEASRELADKLGCELYMYGSEYGHCAFDEAPDYKEKLQDFLQRNR